MPARKPTALKILQGNPGKRAINRHEPKPATPVNPLEPPKHLSADGKRRWRELADQLHAQNLLTDWDYDTFGAYCEAYGQWRLALRHLKTADDYKAANGQISAWYTILTQSRKEMVRIGGLLGLNPADRGKLDVRTAAKDGRSAAEKAFGLVAGG